MPPAVSVVIPVYNRASIVRRAIDSVLAQTYPDFELILVDDGSSDTTTADVGAIADPRLRLIRHEQNRGGSAARNTGVHASYAPFIAFLDSDDEWLPEKLARQLSVFRNSDSRLGLVYTGVERVFEDGIVKQHTPRQCTNLVRALAMENVIGETSVGMVSRLAFDAIGGFDESLPSGQDLDLWIRVCELFRAESIPEVLVRVYKSDDPGRISSNVSRTICGRKLYAGKHRETMVRYGVLHLYLRETGWWQHRRAGDVAAARSSYWRSLTVNAFSLFTYVLLFATFLPSSWLETLARLKRFLTRFLAGSRATHSVSTLGWRRQ